ncbi:MAG: hypothetical protein WAV56_02640 [Microgenomates group bacterium]
MSKKAQYLKEVIHGQESSLYDRFLLVATVGLRFAGLSDRDPHGHGNEHPNGDADIHSDLNTNEHPDGHGNVNAHQHANSEGHAGESLLRRHH